jgi:ribosome recycling factor
MDRDKILHEVQEKMEKTVSVLQGEFRGMRTGRASPGLVENIKVDYYGAPTPLKQIASIVAPESQLLVVRPYDVAAVPEILKAIQKSDIGINPASDGKVIRLSIPPLSEERRKQLAARAKEVAENAKTSLRNIRRDANEEAKQLKEDSQIGEDDLFTLKEKIQEVLKKHEDKVDAMLKSKTQELLTI